MGKGKGRLIRGPRGGGKGEGRIFTGPGSMKEVRRGKGGRDTTHRP